jgi:hypothetical protein
MYCIDLFVTYNILIPGSLVNRIIDMGISPAGQAFDTVNYIKLFPLLIDKQVNPTVII